MYSKASKNQVVSIRIKVDVVWEKKLLAGGFVYHFQRVANFGSSPKRIFRPKYFGRIIFGWNVCIKARTQQNYQGSKVGEAGSDQARKKTEGCRAQKCGTLSVDKYRITKLF